MKTIILLASRTTVSDRLTLAVMVGVFVEVGRLAW
jgi:hypothetical protein